MLNPRDMKLNAMFHMMEIVFFHAFCVHLERTEATAAKELRQELVSFLKRKVCQLA